MQVDSDECTLLCVGTGSALLTTIPPLWDTIDEWPDVNMCA